jgi:release factor glutamine methyltransferase
MSDRVWTVKELLGTARRYLEEKGIENPRGNAEALLGKAMSLPRIELHLQHERPLTESELGAFRTLLKRRAGHEPLQLILGSVEFAGVRIEVQPGVLIPRPETEELTEFAAAQLAPSAGAPLRILDLGTGSGCIAIALAKRYPLAEVDAVDADFEAMRAASRNARTNGVGDRVRAILGDVFSPRFLTSVAPPYDALVSNPPYVTEAEYESLSAEIRAHEPKRALTAGKDGLAFYRRMVELLPDLLRPGGLLAVEIGIRQSEAVASLFRDMLETVSVLPDMAGTPRIVTGRARNNLPSNREHP